VATFPPGLDGLCAAQRGQIVLPETQGQQSEIIVREGEDELDFVVVLAKCRAFNSEMSSAPSTKSL